MLTVTAKRTGDIEDSETVPAHRQRALSVLRYASDYGVHPAADRFGLNRKTVRRWRRRWQTQGPLGLVPRYPAHRRRRIPESTVQLIEHARRDLEYGAARIRIWLERVHRIRVAASTIQRICRQLGYPPIRRTPKRRPRQLTLFSRERPGDCVQVDVKEVKIAGQRCFQYTALDDCTRYRLLRLYPKKDHHTSLQFLSVIRQHYPFAISEDSSRQWDEFSLAFALAVQAAGMRLRYIKPRRHEQNGKVERSHRIDDEEFWSVRTFAVFDSAAAAVQALEQRYNHDRFSMALDGLTPAEKLARCLMRPGLPSLVPRSEPGPNPVTDLPAHSHPESHA
ncbi:helix-turn-helix domain-containing protein [Nitrospira sp. Nam80]